MMMMIIILLLLFENGLASFSSPGMQALSKKIDETKTQ